jgi:hypothetical protein
MVLAAIVFAAAVILLLSSFRWLQLDATRPAPFAPVHEPVKGHREFPALDGLAIVALLVAVLSLVTGSWARRVLGVLLAAVGALCGYYAISAFFLPGHGRQVTLLNGPVSGGFSAIRAQVQPVPAALTLVCAVVLVIAGWALMWRARRWSTGLSARYAAPVEARRVEDPWRRLDRGDDPTDFDS